MSERKVLSLRLDAEPYERIRIEAFNRRVPISDVIREAVDEHLASRSSKGCDVCGKPSTHVTTPGGMRGCADHFPLTLGPNDHRGAVR